jgi:uncharacterized protein YpmS
MYISDFKIRLTSEDINDSVNELISGYKSDLTRLIFVIIEDGLLIDGSYKLKLVNVDFTIKLSNVKINNEFIALDVNLIKTQAGVRLPGNFILSLFSKFINSKLLNYGVSYTNKQVFIDMTKLLVTSPLKNIEIETVKIHNGMLEIEVSAINLILGKGGLNES